MKKQTFSKFGNAVRNTVLRFGLASLLFVSFIPAVHAQDPGKTTTTPPVEIRYLGTINDQPVFQVEFDNKDEEFFNISFRDKDGTLLYSEKFNGKRFSKKFQFEKSVLDQVKLTLAGKKEKQLQIFELNTNVRMVEDVLVTKL